MKGGGHLVPDEFMDDLVALHTSDNPFRWRLMTESRKPLTLRQRLSMKRMRFVGWLHDRLFGSGYCNHEECDY